MLTRGEGGRKLGARIVDESIGTTSVIGFGFTESARTTSETCSTVSDRCSEVSRESSPTGSLAALARLAPRVRACVVLRYLADQSVVEIATALGIAEGTVKRNVYDGVRALAAALGTEDSADDFADVVVKEVAP